MNKVQKRISGILFLSLLFVGMIGGILLPDQAVSKMERRTLAQFPEVSWEEILENDYSDTLETYLLDQFPARDIFRTIKAEFDTGVLRKSDSNGYIRVDGQIMEIPESYDDTRLMQSAEVFNRIATTYFSESNVYYGIIPDKNFFVDSIPGYDLQQARETVGEVMVDAKEIELVSTVKLQDYYRTDLHIKQESLLELADRMIEEMNMQEHMVWEGDYQLATGTDEFYGAYSANSAYRLNPDTLCYLTNEYTEDAQVYDYETDTIGPIYTEEKIGGMDDYDLFLGGARALLTIQNPHADTGKRLIIFRDSFGSSISPLLLSGYEEITLVDLRYVSASYAMDLLQKNNDKGISYDDVVFLYQVQVLYRSRLSF